MDGGFIFIDEVITMIDAKMKRAMKWHTKGYIDTDTVWAVAIKKSLENMDRDSLKRLLNTSYGMTPAYDAILTTMILQELQKRNKEEKKMEDKKYYSGSVAVTTWRSRRTFGDLDDTHSNHRTDLITFREGRYMGTLLDPKVYITAKVPIAGAKSKRFTKEEISEAITSAWDKGEYAEDQTDISWIFNPDPEGFTGTVDLRTVLLKYPKCDEGECCETQTRARCRVRIVDGTFFEKLEGSSKLADILKNHKGVFASKEHIEKYIKDKWRVRDFGNDASYFTLEIEEES